MGSTLAWWMKPSDGPPGKQFVVRGNRGQVRLAMPESLAPSPSYIDLPGSYRSQWLHAASNAHVLRSVRRTAHNAVQHAILERVCALIGNQGNKHAQLPSPRYSESHKIRKQAALRNAPLTCDSISAPSRRSMAQGSQVIARWKQRMGR